LTPRVRDLAVVVTAGLIASLAAATPALAAKPGPGTGIGTARVFMVNPVQSSGDETLTDQKDLATAVPASDYATVQLRNLDGRAR
jgi:zinc metalloprotease ZmpB